MYVKMLYFARGNVTNPVLVTMCFVRAAQGSFHNNADLKYAMLCVKHQDFFGVI